MYTSVQLLVTRQIPETTLIAFNCLYVNALQRLLGMASLLQKIGC